MVKTWTINEIKEAVRAAGSHWFDPGSMRFFGTRVLPEVYQGGGGVFFVTSEQPPHGERQYSVRQFDPDSAGIRTFGEFCAMSKRQAVTSAKRAAIGKGPLGFSSLVPPEEGGLPYEMRGLKTTTEEYKPVAIDEQFLTDLEAHGCDPSLDQVHRLMKLAREHHKLQESACNRQVEEGHDAACEVAITNLATEIGCKGVKFSGDPRGCTVKLVFHDGATDDWGSEGWCVPKSEWEYE
jgi:hypothetical protein